MIVQKQKMLLSCYLRDMITMPLLRTAAGQERCDCLETRDAVQQLLRDITMMPLLTTAAGQERCDCSETKDAVQ